MPISKTNYFPKQRWQLRRMFKKNDSPLGSREVMFNSANKSEQKQKYHSVRLNTGSLLVYPVL